MTIREIDKQASLQALRAIIEKSSQKVSKDPDSYTSGELNSLAQKASEAALKDLIQNIEMRKTLASRLFVLVVGYLLVTVGIVISCGLGWLTLSDSVLIAFLSTFSINFLGLFALVLKYFFQPHGLSHLANLTNE